MSQRVNDQLRFKKAIEAAGLVAVLDNPALQWTCFFPDDSSANWDTPVAFSNGNETVLMSPRTRTDFVYNCTLAKNASDALCVSATKDFSGWLLNVVLQSCIDRTGVPLLTIPDNFPTQNFVPVAGFGNLVTFSGT